jgi:hypothetical protein
MVDVGVADLGEDGFAGCVAVLIKWVEVLAKGTRKKEGLLGEEGLLRSFSMVAGWHSIVGED